MTSPFSPPSRSPDPFALQRAQQPVVTLFAIGMIGLGVLALVYGDFAMVWQPVAAWIPGRTVLAYGSGVLMLLCGAGLLFRSTCAWAIRILFPYLIVWALLKVPAIFAAPGMEAVWLGLGELVALLAGGFTLFACLAEIPAASPLGFLSGQGGVRHARCVFAAAIIPIGLSHIIYVPQTSALIPAWLPAHTFWAYLTGAGQIASGLGILFNVLRRIAAWAEAGQITIYAMLVWLPAVVSAPHVRINWTAFFITWAIGAAAWVVAWNIGRSESPAVESQRPEKS